jgi:hypothetical protein
MYQSEFSKNLAMLKGGTTELARNKQKLNLERKKVTSRLINTSGSEERVPMDSFDNLRRESPYKQPLILGANTPDFRSHSRSSSKAMRRSINQ